MPQLNRTSTISMPCDHEDNNMAHDSRNNEQHSIVIFPPGERLSLEDMSPDDFYREFKQFSRLLLHRENRLVLAASVSGDCDELLQAFREADTTIPDNDLVFWSGPVALRRSADAGLARRRTDGSARGLDR